MKSSINPISLKSLLMLVLSTMTFALFGQVIPEIETRFANPSYDHDTREYYLDVEVLSADEPEQLFGMNFIFYYDASKMAFTGVDQIHQGYGILGDPPKAQLGNEQSGVQLFNLENAAG